MSFERTGWVWPAILVLTGGLVVAAEGGREDVRGRIEAANKEFSEALALGDAARLAGFYASSGQVLPPGSEVVQGREAVQAFWQSVLGSGVKSAELATTDVVAAGDLACETGTYVMKGAEGNVLDRGKYVVVWQREQGQWRIHRDIWSTSLTPEAK